MSCSGLKRLKPGLKRGCEREPGGACIPPCRDPPQFNWPTSNETANNDNAILRPIISGASLKVSKAASLNDLLTGGSQLQVARLALPVLMDRKAPSDSTEKTEITEQTEGPRTFETFRLFRYFRLFRTVLIT